jgi:hypothetical protein
MSAAGVPSSGVEGVRVRLLDSLTRLELLVPEVIAKDRAFEKGCEERARQRSGRDVAPLPPPPRPAPPPVPWTEVVAAWRAGGQRGLEAGGRPLLRAAAYAMQAAPLSPWPDAVAGDPAFVDALLPLLSPRSRQKVLAAVVLGRWPPDPRRWSALVSAVGAGRVPRWWGDGMVPATGLVVGHLVAHFADRVTAGALRGPGDLDLPATLWSGGWAMEVLKMLPADSREGASRAFTFADRGDADAGEGSPVTQEVACSAEKVVRAAVVNPVFRVEALALLRRRLGSPFGADAEARWRGAATLLPLVRSWMVGEVLDLVFRSLVPRTMYQEHTEPRRAFWSRYSSRVEQLMVYASPSLQPRLRDERMRLVARALGVELEGATVIGGSEQALVWMVLRGDEGAVTVIEGNANTAVRAWNGRHPPPQRRYLQFRDDICSGRVVGRQLPQLHQVHNAGQWQREVAHWLWVRGVHPDPGVGGGAR